MATNKKGFILYADLIHTVNQLPNDKAGKLFKHILSYVNDENPSTKDIVIKIAFEPIKQQLKRDLKKFEEVKEKRSHAGKVSAQKRAEQKATNPTRVESVEQTPTNPTVKENDNVTVNVSDNVKEKETVIKTKGGKLVYPEYVYKCYELCLEHFEEHLRPKDEKTKLNWLDTIDKLRQIDKIQYKTILEIVKATRNNWWKKNFLSITKLRKKNGDGIMYIVVFYEQLKSDGKKENGEGYSPEWLAQLAKDLM